MKVFISGKITGQKKYREIFRDREGFLKVKGFAVMNPAVLPYPGFTHEEYLHICYAMIDTCDAVWFMPNWEESTGSKLERAYAEKSGKLIIEEVKYLKGEQEICI